MERPFGQADEDPRELQWKIDQASRFASRVSDQTTVGRLTAWIDELKRKLRQHMEARRTRDASRTRSRELWEQNGRPRLEFWLLAESEITHCGYSENQKFD
jgi:hypothetical protein